MARFTKEIVRAGVHYVADEHGNRREETISPQRLQRWAGQHKMMRDRGLNIPAPTVHDQSANPAHPNVARRQTGRLPKVVMGVAQQNDAFTNGGFWDSMWVEDRPYTDPATGAVSLVPTLMGQLDAPDAYKDKIGSIVKETSIYAAPKFTDGKGTEWKDVIVHAALVTNPVEHNQTNFQPADGLALAMSSFIRPLVMGPPPPKSDKKGKKGNAPSTPGTDDLNDDDDLGTDDLNPGDPESQLAQTPAGSASIMDAVDALRQAGLDVGDDANNVNFIERIIIASRQKALSEGGAGTSTILQPPEGGKKQPASIAMSTAAPAQLTPEAQAQIAAITSQNAILMGIVHQQYADRASARIAALVARGAITKEIADAQLTPLLPAVKMAVDAQGKVIPNELDRMLTLLESLPSRAAAPQVNPLAQLAGNVVLPGTAMSVPADFANQLALAMSIPPGAVGEPPPGGTQMTATELDKAADEMIASSGFVQFAR